MNPTRFPNTCKFLDMYLFNRYENIDLEEKPMYKLPEILSHPRLRKEYRESKMIESLCKINRVEPENPYILHRLTPSARNLNSNNIELTVLDITQNCETVYEWSPVTEGLYLTKTQEKKHSVNTISISYNYEKIGSLYGRFGFLLSLLDAGHQINFLRETSTDGIYVSYFPRKQVIADITIDSPETLIKEDASLFIAQNEVYSDEIFSKMMAEVNGEHRQNIDVRNPISNQIINKQPVKKYPLNPNYSKSISKRSSSQSFQGLTFTKSEKRSEIDFDRLLATKNPDFIDGLTCIWGDIKKKTSKNSLGESLQYIEAENVLFDTLDYIDLENADYYFLIGVKKGDYTPFEILSSFINAGEWMDQIGSKLSSNFNVVRCLRNMDDKRILSIYKDMELMLYFMIVGNNKQDESYKEVLK